MRVLWKQYREYFVIAAFAVVLLGVARFGVWTLFMRNQDTLNAIQENAVDRKMFEEEYQKIPEMKAQAETIAAASDRLNAFLAKDEVVHLVESLEALGSTMNVSVSAEAASDSVVSAFLSEKKKPTARQGATTDKESTHDVSAEDGDDKKMPDRLLPALPSDRAVFIVIKAKGLYPDVVRFSEKLDTSPVLLDVLSVSILPETDDVSSDALSTRPTLFSGAPSANTPEILSAGNVDAASSRKPTMVMGSLLTAIYLNPS